MGSFLRGALALSLLGFVAACSNNGVKGDGGGVAGIGSTSAGGSGSSSGSGSAGSGTTGSSGGLGPRPDGGVDGGSGACHYDLDCAGSHGVCADGGCQPATELCHPTFQGAPDCASSKCQDSLGNPLCYCHPDATSDAGGFCYLPLPACAPCSNSIDCNSQTLSGTPGYCLPLDGGSFCLPDGTSGCGSFPGFTLGAFDGGLLVCSPACNTCPCSAGCTRNSDCKAIDAGVCGSNHLCLSPCTGQGDCAPGQVCHSLDKYLDPTLTLSPLTAPLYAGGECGPACQTTADCAVYQSVGGVALGCQADPAESNGHRCRPTGCVSDRECSSTQVAPDASYRPWCDVFNANACVGNACRLGGADCTAGNYCVADGGKLPTDGGAPGTGECASAPCYFSGAVISCAIDDLCCGEGDAGVSTCPSSVSLGDCYQAPQPPWCNSCDPSTGAFGHAECARPANALQFGGAGGASFCAQTQTGGICQPACDRNVLSSCPNGWDCTDQLSAQSDCSGCGVNPCVDAGMFRLCACVDDAGSGCPGQGQNPVGCSPAGLCSFGTYCAATSHACP